MSGGHSFEFSPFAGIVEVDSSGGGNAEQIVPANAELFRAPDQTIPKRSATPIKPAHPAKQPTKPLNVLKAAKARLREVERDLKRLAKLEVERDELKRLIHAAENKPCAIVRDIAAKRG